MMTICKKTYSKLIEIESFDERFDYLKMIGRVGDITFGGRRKLNQMLYGSDRWKKVRREIILRDDGNDLSHPDYPIHGPIYIHHINPITIEDILQGRPCVFDIDNLVCTSFRTHEAIHYGSKNSLTISPIIRTINDTCPWR